MRAHPHASVFHSSAWARVLAESYDYTPRYFMARKDGRLAALFPMMEVKGIFSGKRGVGLPFSDYCDPLLDSETSLEEAIAGLISHADQEGLCSLELRCRETLPFDVPPSTTFLHHQMDLKEDEESMFRGFRGSTQRNIRKSMKEGVELFVSESLDDVMEFDRLNCLTRRQHGLPPQPLNFFRNLQKLVMAKGKGFVVLARRNGVSISAAVYLQFGEKAYYKYGASDIRSQHLRANNLVMWEAIRILSRKGCRTLCLGRSEPENEGLRQFKNGWGTTERHLHYYRYDLRKRKYLSGNQHVYGIHNHIFRNLPLSVSRMVGNILYRYIG